MSNPNLWDCTCEGYPFLTGCPHCSHFAKDEDLHGVPHADVAQAVACAEEPHMGRFMIPEGY